MRPKAAERVVRLFNFDEPTPNPVPDHWVRAQDASGRPVPLPTPPKGKPKPPVEVPAGARPGFPPINEAEIDHDVAYSGGQSVRLPTRGGSTSLQLTSGVLPVFSDADYRVTAQIRTQGLTVARALVVVRFLDAEGRPVGTEYQTPPIISEGEWKQVAVEVAGGERSAAYLQLELLVLQPRQMGASPGPWYVWEEDYSGAAWFDDVAVMQLPRIDFRTKQPGGVVVRPERPAFDISVRDLTGEALLFDLSVVDSRGRVVDHTVREAGSGKSSLVWEPAVDRLGWYRATLDVQSGGHRVGGRTVDFVYVEDTAGSGPESVPKLMKFGVALDDTPPGGESAIRPLVRGLGVGAASVPLWPMGIAAGEAGKRVERITPVVEGLTAELREITLSIEGVPPEIAGSARANATDVLTACKAPGGVRAEVLALLAPAMEKYGPSIRRWEFGRAGQIAAAGRANLADDVSALQRAISKMVPGPLLVVGAAPEQGARALPSGQTALAIGLDSGSEPRAAGQLVDAWRTSSPAASELRLVLEEPGVAAFGAGESASHAAKSMIEAYAAITKASPCGSKIWVRQPWNWSEAQPCPTPAFATERNVINQVAGRECVGEYPLGDGLRCLIFGPAPGRKTGVLVAWNESAGDVEHAEVRLGERMQVIDQWGNALEASSGAGRGVVLNLGREPVFVTGVDVDLARLLSSVKLEPAVLSSDGQRQDLAIVVRNPFAKPVSGQATILEPGLLPEGKGVDREWLIQPRSSRFAIGPGETVRLPVSVAFSTSEESGRRDFVIEFELSGDKAFAPVKLRLPVWIGLEQLKVELTSRPAPGPQGPDVAVDVYVTNAGGKAVSLDITGFAPGQPRARSSVKDLAAGNHTSRRLVFKDAAATLSGKRIVVSVADVESGAKLNAGVAAP